MSDSAEELRAAQEMLYEDESLRSHLTDEQAAPLLEWAARRLAAAGGSGVERAHEKVRAVLRLVDQAAAGGGDPAATLGRLPGLVRELPGDGPPPPLPSSLARFAGAADRALPGPATHERQAGDSGAGASTPGRGLDLAGFVTPGVAQPGGPGSPQPAIRTASESQRRWKTGWRSRRGCRFTGAPRRKRTRGGSAA